MMFRGKRGREGEEWRWVALLTLPGVVPEGLVSTIGAPLLLLGVGSEVGAGTRPVASAATAGL